MIDQQQSRVMDGPILFFDGSCALCARTVQWALRHDKRAVLRFAPLNGATHRQLGCPGADEGGSTLILVNNGQVFMRSAGALRFLWSLGGGWNLLGRVLWLIPRPLRDVGYRFIAARRYRWFGRVDACATPTKALSQRILE